VSIFLRIVSPCMLFLSFLVYGQGNVEFLPDDAEQNGTSFASCNDQGVVGGVYTIDCPSNINLPNNKTVGLSQTPLRLIINGDLNLNGTDINPNGSSRDLLVVVTGNLNPGNSNTTINANLDITGSLNGANNNAISGGLSIGGNVTLGNNSSIAGDIDVTGNLSTGNNIKINSESTITVGGNAVFGQNNDIKGAINATNVTVNGNKTILTGDITASGNLVSNGTINGNIDVDGNVNNNGFGVINGNVNVDGNLQNNGVINGDYVNAPCVSSPNANACGNGAINVEETCDINDNEGPCFGGPGSSGPDFIGDWHFDEQRWNGTNGEVINSVSSLYNGRAISRAETKAFSPARAGGVGTCRYGSFDGNSYVEIPNVSELANQDSVSVSLWFKGGGERQDSNENYQTLLILGEGPTQDRNGRFEVYRRTNGGGVNFEIRTNNDKIHTVEYGRFGSPQLFDDSWHHLAATYDASTRTLILYIDGTEVAETQFNGQRQLNNIGNNPNLYIGGQQFPGFGINGYIDEVTVATGVYTQTDVTELFQRTRPCSGLPVLAQCADVWQQNADLSGNTVPQPFELPDTSSENPLPAQLMPTDYLRVGDFGDVGADYQTNGTTSRVYIDGDLTITEGRRINTSGDPNELIMIVTGDLTIERDVQINGYIYVQGNYNYSLAGNWWFGCFNSRPIIINGGISVGGSSAAVSGCGDEPTYNYTSPVDPLDGGQFCIANPPEPPEPLLNWRLNRGPWDNGQADIFDSSGNGFNGINNNIGWRPADAQSAIPTNFNNEGTCGYGEFRISQKSNIVIADNSEGLNNQLDFDGSEAFTVGAWIKPRSLPTGSGLMTIASKDTNYEFHLTSSGEINWWWLNSSGQVRSFNSGFRVPLNRWSYVAIRYQSSKFQISVIDKDFQEVTTATYTSISGVDTNDQPFIVGNDIGQQRYFDGNIDEVSVFAHSLTQSELIATARKTTLCEAATPSVDHYRISFNSPALTCSGAEVRVTACQTSDCDTQYTDNASVALALATGADNWSENPVNFVADTSTQLQKYTSGDYALSVSTSSPAADNPARCFVNGVEDSGCSIRFDDTGLIFTEGSDINSTSLSKQTAGQTFSNLNLQTVSLDEGTLQCQTAIEQVNSITIGRECVEPVNCSDTTMYPQSEMSVSSSSGASVLLPADESRVTLPVNFSGGREALTLNYGDVGAVRLRAQATLPNGKEISGISSAFVWQPAKLSISADNPSSTYSNGIFAKAGELFSVGLQALNANNELTPNFGNEQSAERLVLRPDVLVTPVCTQLPTATAARAPENCEVQGELVNPEAFADPVNGETQNSALSYSEVGKPTFVGVIESGDYLAGYHPYEPSPAINLTPGRFIPAKFELYTTGLQATCSGAEQFFYYGQPQRIDSSFKLTALNMNDQPTVNYDDALTYVSGDSGLEFYPFNKADSSAPQPELSLLDAENIILDWQNGEGWLATPSTAQLRYQRDPNAPGEPFNDYRAGVQYNDGENNNYYSSIVISEADRLNHNEAPRDYHALNNESFGLVYGRIQLENIFGPSEDLLPIRAVAEYWDGTAFRRHELENECLEIAANDIVQSDEYGDFIDVNDSDYEAELTPSTGTQSFTSGRLFDPNLDITFQFSWQSPNPKAYDSFIFGLKVPPYLKTNVDGSGGNDDFPEAEATFGIYRGSDRQIYWQEVGW